MSVDVLDIPGVDELIPKDFGPDARRLIAERALKGVEDAAGTRDPEGLTPLYVRGIVSEEVQNLGEAIAFARSQVPKSDEKVGSPTK